MSVNFIDLKVTPRIVLLVLEIDTDYRMRSPGAWAEPARVD